MDTAYDLFRAQCLQYIGLAIAQPFENAKILLQCQYIPSQLTNAPTDTAADVEEEEEDEEPDYFSESQNHVQAERRATDRSGYILQNDGDPPTVPPWQIAPKMPPALRTVLEAVWKSEGWGGSFKATNITFCYSLLREILEGQITGVASVLLGLPDPSLELDATDAAPLMITLLASAVSALLLAPLDIARTKIILTPASEPRGVLATLRGLPSRICPSALLLPTLLERLVPILLQHSVSNVFEPLSGLIRLFVGLPLETILHRAQAAYSPPRKSMVHLGTYSGIFGTPWWISTQEGDGVLGLYRGWKAGVWSVVGLWSLSLLNQEKRIETEF